MDNSLIVSTLTEYGGWAWLIAGAALLILEVFAPGVFLIWFGVAAAVVGVVALNVELPLLVARVPRGEARERAREALDLIGLLRRADHVPDELSGGERQRVTITRSLVNDPAIVWADEPTGDLDSENATEIVDLMRRLNQERGLTFLIVTHDISVGRRTDRIVRMLDGAVVEEQRMEVPRVLAGRAV